MSNLPSVLPRCPEPVATVPRFATLPFRLPLPEDVRTHGGDVLCRAPHVRGVATLRGDALVLEWSGTTQVTDVRGSAVAVRREPFPGGERVLALADLVAITRRGWWWRPRVELEVAALDAFAGVPGAEGPRLSLAVAIGDLGPAGRFVIAARRQLAARWSWRVDP